MAQSPTASKMTMLLAQVLDDYGTSQTEFSRTVGYSQKHISQAFLGRVGVSLGTLDYWAQALGVEFVVTIRQV